ncbi:Na-translocating system protein MpsC family protein [Alteribacillus bidgolensis]
MLEEYSGKEAIHNEIARVSKHAEKLPASLDSCMINDRTLIITRDGILVRIEKELIRSGFEEELKLTKRHLEKRLLHASKFEAILQTNVADIFVDWDFKLDKSYIIIILQPNKH